MKIDGNMASSASESASGSSRRSQCTTEALLRRCCSPVFAPVATTHAQTYPAKPIRIVTVAPGGTPDPYARLISQGITGALGQPLVVDNRVGFVGIEIVSKAPPDGYTLAVNGQNLWILPFLQPNLPYDPIRDFAPVSLVTRAPNVLVVHPSVPVKTVDDLIALARAKPGALNYGTGDPGSSNHLSAELFKAMSGVSLVLINYKGAPVLRSTACWAVKCSSCLRASVPPRRTSRRANCGRSP